MESSELGEAGWQAWRQVRQEALAQAPAAFGSTMAQCSGVGDAATDTSWARPDVDDGSPSIKAHIDRDEE